MIKEAILELKGLFFRTRVQEPAEKQKPHDGFRVVLKGLMATSVVQEVIKLEFVIDDAWNDVAVVFTMKALLEIQEEPEYFWRSLPLDWTSRLVITYCVVWGCSSAGRAPPLHGGGHRFDPVHLHHRTLPSSNGRVLFFAAGRTRFQRQPVPFTEQNRAFCFNRREG